MEQPTVVTIDRWSLRQISLLQYLYNCRLVWCPTCMIACDLLSVHTPLDVYPMAC